MSGNQPEIIRIIAWFGMAFFCGVLPILFAAILTYSYRKRSRLGNQIRTAKKMALSQLQVGTGLVRVEGQIAAGSTWLDGGQEDALVYLRLWVEEYEEGIGEDERGGWKTLVNKEKGIPFFVSDQTSRVRVNPDGLDKDLVGDGIVPTDEQISTACDLLGISPGILRGRLRYKLWELRAGQMVTVIGNVSQGTEELELCKVANNPLVVSTYMGKALDDKVKTQVKTAGFWALVLGIPGMSCFLCGLCNGLISLVRFITK